uniref:(California timema) hypothetical protein n=1 Tax=Timema californicum TaxID=61474 RepID=A0A7R9J7E9_TIMCA|nr:unnamed protein product [Timema californicum]
MSRATNIDCISKLITAKKQPREYLAAIANTLTKIIDISGADTSLIDVDLKGSTTDLCSGREKDQDNLLLAIASRYPDLPRPEEDTKDSDIQNQRHLHHFHKGLDDGHRTSRGRRRRSHILSGVWATNHPSTHVSKTIPWYGDVGGGGRSSQRLGSLPMAAASQPSPLDSTRQWSNHWVYKRNLMGDSGLLAVRGDPNNNREFQPNSIRLGVDNTTALNCTMTSQDLVFAKPRLVQLNFWAMDVLKEGDLDTFWVEPVLNPADRASREVTLSSLLLDPSTAEVMREFDVPEL